MFDPNDKKPFHHGVGGLFPPEKPRFTLSEDMLHTMTEMRQTIDRMLKFEHRVECEVHDLMSKLTSDNCLFKDTFASSFTLFKEEVKNEINLFESNLDNTIKLFTDNLKGDYDGLVEEVQGQHVENLKQYEAKLKEAESEMDAIFEAFKSNVESMISNEGDSNADFQRKLTTEFNMFEADINQKFRNFTDTITETNDSFKETWTAAVEERLDAQDTRISNAERYMKTNLEASVRTELGDMYDSGDFAEILEGEVFADIQAKMDDIDADVKQSINEATNNVETMIDECEDKMAELESRMENIVGDGTPSEGNTELLDIRIGADNTTYATAGEAVRTQINNVNASIAATKEAVNEQFEVVKDELSQMTGDKEFKLVHTKNVSHTVTTENRLLRTFSQLWFEEGKRYKVVVELDSFTPYEYATSCFYVASSSDNASPPSVVDHITDEAGTPIDALQDRYEIIFTPSADAKFLYIFTQAQPNTTRNFTINVYEEVDAWNESELTQTTLINHSSTLTAYSTKLYFPARLVKGCHYKVHLKVNDISLASGETRDYLDIRTNRKADATDISADLVMVTPNNWRGKTDYWVDFTPTETTDYIYVFTCSQANALFGFTLEIKCDANQAYIQNEIYPPITMYGIGDSIMTTTYGRFIDTLQTRYNVTTTRYAEGSTGFATNNNVSSKTTFYNRVASMPATAPDIILIEGGTNDFGKNMTIEQTVAAVEQTIQKLYNKYPGTPILGVLPAQRYYFGSAEAVKGMINDIGVNLIDYVDAIKEVFDKYGYPTIDLCRNSGLNELNVADLTVDGLHWNDELHDRVSDMLYPEIKRYAKKD